MNGRSERILDRKREEQEYRRRKGQVDSRLGRCVDRRRDEWGEMRRKERVDKRRE